MTAGKSLLVYCRRRFVFRMIMYDSTNNPVAINGGQSLSLFQ